MPFDDPSITNRAGRLLLILVTAAMLAVGVTIAAWDLVIATRLVTERCRELPAATESPEAEGRMVQPEYRGTCADFLCVDAVRTAPRIVLPDIESVERVGTNC